MVLIFFLLLLLFFGIFVSIITFIHELGHFYVARRNNVRVSEFAVGFGPAIYQKRINLTTFSIRLFPFGGYVSVLTDDVIQMIGKINQNLNQVDERQQKLIEKKLNGLTLNENFENQITLEKIKNHKKFVFALAGILFNFLSIFIALTITYTISGREISNDTLRLDGVIFKEIISPGNDDEVSSLTPVYVSDLAYQIGNNDPVILSGYDDLYNAFDSYFTTVHDDGVRNSYQSVVLYTEGDNNQRVAYYQFGITQASLDIYDYQSQSLIRHYDLNTYIDFLSYRTEGAYYIEYALPISLYYAFIDSFKYIYQGIIITINLLFGVFTPDNRIIESYHNINGSESLITFQVLIDYFVILSMITLLFNVVPFPPLDGWRAFEYTYESISKKKISASFTRTLIMLGLIFMFIWFFFVIF